jgi:hypothetical protein
MLIGALTFAEERSEEGLGLKLAKVEQAGCVGAAAPGTRPDFHRRQTLGPEPATQRPRLRTPEVAKVALRGAVIEAKPIRITETRGISVAHHEHFVGRKPEPGKGRCARRPRDPQQRD